MPRMACQPSQHDCILLEAYESEEAELGLEGLFWRSTAEVPERLNLFTYSLFNEALIILGDCYWPSANVLSYIWQLLQETVYECLQGWDFLSQDSQTSLLAFQVVMIVDVGCYDEVQKGH
mmetsp:Transcript_831/g.1859  ORF Transcript_831/g.1859 Transcript_831/m.1859 type:complete len:120 (+) Transcript_831:2939-3298(+)